MWIIIIHPNWEIPEKIITIRGLDIDIIIIEPVNKLIYLIVSLVITTMDKTRRGAIFCQLMIRYKPKELREERTLGSQKWRGAAPSFIIIPKIIKTIRVLLVIIALLRMVIDPTLCTIKYIIACFLLVSSFITLGTNLIKLNSRPSQIRGQELKEITAKAPRRIPSIICFNENKAGYL